MSDDSISMEKKMGLVELETSFSIPTPEIYRFKRKMGLI